MRKLVGILAVVALVATPALADLSKLSPQMEENVLIPGQHTVGVFASGDPTGGIYLSYKIIAAQSDLVRVTFGLDWPSLNTRYAIQVQHGFTYDNSEVQVVRQGGAGPFANSPFNNYFGSSTWQGGVPVTTGGATLNPSSGTIDIAAFYGAYPSAINPSVSVTGPYGTAIPSAMKLEPAIPVTISGTLVGYDLHAYPVFYVDLHVKDVVSDSFLDAIVASAAWLYHITPFSAASNTYWTGGGVGTYHYGIGIVPEPASLSLLGMGMAAVGLGAWRRRRR